jgi:hypothetical protein
MSREMATRFASYEHDVDCKPARTGVSMVDMSMSSQIGVSSREEGSV